MVSDNVKVIEDIAQLIRVHYLTQFTIDVLVDLKGIGHDINTQQEFDEALRVYSGFRSALDGTLLPKGLVCRFTEVSTDGSNKQKCEVHSLTRDGLAFFRDMGVILSHGAFTGAYR